MNWAEPCTIRDLLDRCARDDSARPPVGPSVYLITERFWEPSRYEDDWDRIRAAKPLYVGDNSKNPQRFRTRVGDFIADLFGFCVLRDKDLDGQGDGTGHHPGARRVREWCHERPDDPDLRGDPSLLWITWLESCDCGHCAEWQSFWELNGSLLNRNTPPQCRRPQCLGWPALQDLKKERQGSSSRKRSGRAEE